MKILLNFSLKLLKSFWRFLLFLKQFVNFLSCFLLFCVLVSMLYFYIIQKKNINSYQGALLIDLNGKIVDQINSNNSIEKTINHFLFLSKEKQDLSLFDIVYNIRKSIFDEKITGIVLKLDNLADSDQTSLEYIGKALNEFKNSGKIVYSIGSNYTQSQYYLASFANKIYMSPHGSVDIHGFSTNRFYYKELLDNIKINRHIFRIGKYKSAVEPLIRNNISKESRNSDFSLINTLWNNYLFTVSSNRNTGYKNIFPGTNKLIEKLKFLKGDSAEYAKNQNIVDDLLNEIDLKKKLIDIFGCNKKNNSFNYISINDYKDIVLKYKNKKKYHNFKPNIAVIVVQGIMNWKNESGFVENKSIIDKIEKAKINPNIKAVILRINSPGGSVYSAETIRDQLIELKNTGKPIIVSMGGVAASAGYWISTPADYIISNSISITGSIGIFGLINTLEKSLSSIGVNTDGVSTTSLADNSITKGINKDFSDIMRINIENGYYKFIKYVSDSRHKSMQEIDKIGQGKVWIGLDAFKNGLVDSLGDFDTAVNKAMELGNIKTPFIDWMEEKSSFLESLFLKLMDIFSLNRLNYFINQKYFIGLPNKINLFDKINDPKNEYSICLSCMNLN